MLPFQEAIKPWPRLLHPCLGVTGIRPPPGGPQAQMNWVSATCFLGAYNVIEIAAQPQSPCCLSRHAKLAYCLGVGPKQLLLVIESAIVNHLTKYMSQARHKHGMASRRRSTDQATKSGFLPPDRTPQQETLTRLPNPGALKRLKALKGSKVQPRILRTSGTSNVLPLPSFQGNKKGKQGWSKQSKQARRASNTSGATSTIRASGPSRTSRTSRSGRADKADKALPRHLSFAQCARLII